MRKILIIANMLFASATVFGMDQLIQTEEILGVDQSKNMTDLSIKKDACKRLFDFVQSELKENNRFSDDAKLLYSKLKFEDVWDAIEQVFFSISPDESNSANVLNNLEISFKQMVKDTKLRDALYKFYSTEEVGKRKAKFLYKQVLGNSELGKDLYEKAIKTIDSAEYVQRSDRACFLNSFSELSTGKVKCFYYEKGNLLRTLVHETGHVLDVHYKRRTKFGRLITSKFEDWQVFQKEWFNKLADKWIYSKDNQAENVSIFFESLLESDRLKGNLIKDYSMQYRIYEIFLNFVNNSLSHELMVSYSKDQLSDGGLKKQYLPDYEKIIISELEKHDKIKIYIDSLRKLDRVLLPDCKPLNEDEENLWRDLLQKLESQGYTELSQLLSDIDRDKSEARSIGYVLVIDKFIFKKGSEEINESLPELDGIDWEKIYNIAFSIQYYQGISEEEGSLWDNLIRVLDDRGYKSLSQLLHGIETGESSVTGSCWRSSGVVNKFIFLKGSEEKEVMIPQLDGINWEEIYNLAKKKNFYTKAHSFFENRMLDALDLKQKKEEINLETHTVGAYNAFKMLKDGKYLQMLKDGEPLPIKEVMKKLTGSTDLLNLTEESVEEFFEFLKTGKLVS